MSHNNLGQIAQEAINVLSESLNNIPNFNGRAVLMFSGGGQ